MDDGNRVTIKVDLDKTLVDSAKAAGLDVRGIIELSLRRELREARRAAMTEADRADLLRQINEEVASRNRMIEEDGLLGQEWRTF